MKGANLCCASTLLIAAALLACADAERAHDTTTRAEATTRAPMDIGEERDGLWITDSAGERRRLTAMRVAGFDFDSLAAKQREGEVILYWAAAPTPSPDGSLVAYATNREAVTSDTSGQSIWLLELESSHERALLHVPGHSYRPVGWLEHDVVYIGDEPGVWAVDPESGERRQLSRGAFIAADDDGGAIVVADGLPDVPRMEVITPVTSTPVPSAPPGFVYLPEASFADDGGRLLLEATPDSGYTRARFAFDLRTGRLEPLE